jgi:Holliday junction DNA helicase RuvA
MIGFLRGRLLEKHPDRLLVDVQGVGYEVAVPLSTFYSLPDAGGELSLRIHTHVREDHIALFGFATVLEQQLFERLIGVSGIGPKIALAALSGIEPAALVRAVRTADVARLTGIPGIGKKTAERIALELKDKLPAGGAAAGGAVMEPPGEGDQRDDLLSALVNLGYQRAAAEKAIDAALKALGRSAAFEAVLRESLKSLMR